jgi:hypothetical protein
LDAASRGGTGQPVAPALIRTNVTGRHDEAPRNMIAHGLVMRRSRVRIPKAALRSTTGWAFDLGFPFFIDLGVRANRTLKVYASQCVGLKLTASGRCGPQGCDLGIYPMLSASPARPIRTGGHVVAERADRLSVNREIDGSQENASCEVPTIAPSSCVPSGSRRAVAIGDRTVAVQSTARPDDHACFRCWVSCWNVVQAWWSVPSPRG